MKHTNKRKNLKKKSKSKNKRRNGGAKAFMKSFTTNPNVSSVLPNSTNSTNSSILNYNNSGNMTEVRDILGIQTPENFMNGTNEQKIMAEELSEGIKEIAQKRKVESKLLSDFYLENRELLLDFSNKFFSQHPQKFDKVQQKLTELQDEEKFKQFIKENETFINTTVNDTIFSNDTLITSAGTGSAQIITKNPSISPSPKPSTTPFINKNTIHTYPPWYVSKTLYPMATTSPSEPPIKITRSPVELQCYKVIDGVCYSFLKYYFYGWLIIGVCSWPFFLAFVCYTTQRPYVTPGADDGNFSVFMCTGFWSGVAWPLLWGFMITYYVLRYYSNNNNNNNNNNQMSLQNPNENSDFRPFGASFV
jgi:hypothetical protein